MNENGKYYCDSCGEDITEKVHAEAVALIRRKNMKRVNKNKTPEQIEARNKAGEKKLREWREKNPETAANLARLASAARTPESHKKQAATLRINNEKRMIVFAELVYNAKQQGREITPEVHAELLQQAKDIVRNKK